MPPEIAETQPSNATAKVRLLCLSDLDKRTVAYRRTELLINRIENDLGGTNQLSEAVRQIIRRAAISAAMAEDLATRWLGGETVDPATYATLCNNERRLYEAIGLQRVPREIVPTVDRYLAGEGKAAP
jgi:hypothetical protein